MNGDNPSDLSAKLLFQTCFLGIAENKTVPLNHHFTVHYRGANTQSKTMQLPAFWLIKELIVLETFHSIHLASMQNEQMPSRRAILRSNGAGDWIMVDILVILYTSLLYVSNRIKQNVRSN